MIFNLAQISILKYEGIIGKIYYERRVYESVADLILSLKNLILYLIIYKIIFFSKSYPIFKKIDGKSIQPVKGKYKVN